MPTSCMRCAATSTSCGAGSARRPWHKKERKDEMFRGRGAVMKPHVVVIGCGFGGIEAVRGLSKGEVEITLVDRTNHHLFQPLLYQVATAGLSAPAVSAPIRHVLRREMRRGNLTILQAEATDIDVASREVVLARSGDAPGAIDRVGYDHLIVAA